MKNSQHLGFWLLLAILGFFAAPLLRAGDKMEVYLAAEIAETRSAMGPTIGGWVVGFADSMFAHSPIAVAASGIAQAKHTKEEQRLSARVGGAGGEIMSKLYNSYLQGLIMQAYVLTMRLAIVLFWLAALIPVFVASVYDGLMQRSVKQAEFGSLRPATFTLAGMLVIPVLSLPALYLTLPFSLSPLLAPVWAVIVAIPLSVLVSNSQPLFGR
ncbi:DUF4400 domain-containing protein [Caenimonas sedimenti]|uniref:DUF4400 domain-containing protein n=1 Tax=Caenimonas sedimenti TaxID=2596921 RepID=A0A562ZSX7_9BURK|nr:DUF4400 domain-containing protein [Caenimonas sedimenti]TWO71466.1 DUF4400 domain-containing protein [Caenimonas sedimenti]